MGLEGYAEERVFAGGYEISTIEEKIGRYNSDRIIVVTHEVPAFVYSQHMIKILGIDKKAKDLDNGECAYFNLEGKTYQILRHSDKVEADISI